MTNFTITVVGAGVIGTSIGLALKQGKEPPRLLVHDKELTTAKAAVKLGAFDAAEWNLVNACEKADLIILAIPINGIRFTLEAIAPYLKQGAVISDTASSKTPVLDWATTLLPAHAHFVGGNPIVHPNGSGHEYARADLFNRRLYCLTPAASANEQAVQLMVGLVSLLGAEPYFLDAAEHDGLLTAVEHLPRLVSAALLRALSGPGSWRELRKLAGGMFEQASAGAAGDPDAIKDSFLANRDTLLHWLDAFVAQMQEFRGLLADEATPEETLARWLDKALVERHNWLVDYQQGRFLDPELAPPKIEQRGLMKQLFGLGR